MFLILYHVWATVKRRCLWTLLFISMRRNSRGELRGDSVVGDSRGDTEDGDFLPRWCWGRSCWSRFSLSIRTRSSLSPVWSPWWICLTGTASVSWLPPDWAITELDGNNWNTTARLEQIKELSQSWKRSLESNAVLSNAVLCQPCMFSSFCRHPCEILSSTTMQPKL